MHVSKNNYLECHSADRGKRFAIHGFLILPSHLPLASRGFDYLGSTYTSLQVYVCTKCVCMQMDLSEHFKNLQLHQSFIYTQNMLPGFHKLHTFLDSQHIKLQDLALKCAINDQVYTVQGIPKLLF